MKNKKYKHSTTTRLKPVSLRLRVAMATQGWAHTPLKSVLQLTYVRILWENGQYMACRGTFNICFSTTYILMLLTVFKQRDAEVSEVRVYTCCRRFWHWLGDWARAKNWIFVTWCTYVAAGVHIENVKYNFNRMFCAVSPLALRTAFD